MDDYTFLVKECVPSLKVVASVLHCAIVLYKNKELMCIWDASRALFGRDAFFESHNKMVSVCSRCAYIPDIVSVIKSLHAFMLRTGKSNPFPGIDFERGTWTSSFLWQRAYLLHLA